MWYIWIESFYKLVSGVGKAEAPTWPGIGLVGDAEGEEADPGAEERDVPNGREPLEVHPKRLSLEQSLPVFTTAG